MDQLEDESITYQIIFTLLLVLQDQDVQILSIAQMYYVMLHITETRNQGKVWTPNSIFDGFTKYISKATKLRDKESIQFIRNQLEELQMPELAFVQLWNLQPKNLEEAKAIVKNLENVEENKIIEAINLLQQKQAF